MQNILKNYHNYIYQIIRTNIYAHKTYAFIYRPSIEINILLLEISIFNNL